MNFHESQILEKQVVATFTPKISWISRPKAHKTIYTTPRSAKKNYILRRGKSYIGINLTFSMYVMYFKALRGWLKRDLSIILLDFWGKGSQIWQKSSFGEEFHTN